ncbi:MAG: hypothetical protein JWP11_1952, partial [Frankiales bacterium]|nr:hypothetical protein [Frankiales bacterium]
MMPPRQAALGPAVIGVVLLAAAPAPSAALATLRETATAPDATAPVLALVALVAWALLAWLLLVATAATLAARGPGAAGRVADAVARRVAPVAIRRVVEV